MAGGGMGLTPDDRDSVAALCPPCLGKVNGGGWSPMKRRGQVAFGIIRSQSSCPSQTSPTQPDPVLNTVIVLNLIKKTNKKIFKLKMRQLY